MNNLPVDDTRKMQMLYLESLFELLQQSNSQARKHEKPDNRALNQCKELYPSNHQLVQVSKIMGICMS